MSTHKDELTIEVYAEDGMDPFITGAWGKLRELRDLTTLCDACHGGHHGR